MPTPDTVAAGRFLPALGVGFFALFPPSPDARAGGLLCLIHQTSSSSASLRLSSSSIPSTCALVMASSSFSPRVPSSSPASPSLTSLSRVSLALRRMLRMETLASSPLDLTILTYSLRRSLVSSGNGDPDDVAVVGGIGAHLGVAQGAFDVAQGRLVVRGDEDGAGVRDREGGQLLQRRRGAVVLDHDLVVQARRGAAGPDRGEVFLGYLNCLVHLVPGFEQGFFDHGLSSEIGASAAAGARHGFLCACVFRLAPVSPA